MRLALACLPVLLALSACSQPANDTFPGYAEADYVRLASPVGGTLARLYLKRGEQGAQQALAFVLEQDNEKAARAAAVARLARSQATLDNLLTGRRPEELAVTEAQLAQSEAAARQSQTNLQRLQALKQARFVADAAIDEARAAAERDAARVKELHAQVKVGRLAARGAEIAAAREDIKAAQAAVDQADWQLAQKAVRLPRAGAVADILYREGELVPAGQPVISLLVPDYVRARFFVPQAMLGRLQLGQTVNLHCDGCAAPVPATISFIAHDAEYTAPLIYSRENRAGLVFMVEAQPAPAKGFQLHPGQPLEVQLAAAPKAP